MTIDNPALAGVFQILPPWAAPGFSIHWESEFGLPPFYLPIIMRVPGSVARPRVPCTVFGSFEACQFARWAGSCTEDWVGGLPAGAASCILPVCREIKMERRPRPGWQWAT